MSYVVALPEVLASSAERLVILGSSLAEANLAAAGGTTQLLAAAEDDVRRRSRRCSPRTARATKNSAVTYRRCTAGSCRPLPAAHRPTRRRRR
ncbi:PE family protein [Mycobacterium paragordonae]|nr:PE family protein [Mycobacterium paragordonae]TDL03924.1 PE family protein [Mycobacterium paragordonae]